MCKLQAAAAGAALAAGQQCQRPSQPDVTITSTRLMRQMRGPLVHKVGALGRAGGGGLPLRRLRGCGWPRHLPANFSRYYERSEPRMGGAVSGRGFRRGQRGPAGSPNCGEGTVCSLQAGQRSLCGHASPWASCRRPGPPPPLQPPPHLSGPQLLAASSLLVPSIISCMDSSPSLPAGDVCWAPRHAQ